MINGNVIIFTNEFSDNRRIPSVVCFIDNRWIIGVTARNLMTEYSESSLYESKRLIGLKYSNPQVQEYIKDGLWKKLKFQKITNQNMLLKCIMKIKNIFLKMFNLWFFNI